MSADGAKWFYTPDGTQTVGPVSIDELSKAVLDGRIVAATAVWTQAFGREWKRADSVGELRGAWIAAEEARIAAVTATRPATVPVATAVARSLDFCVRALFRPFSLAVWLGIALCCVMTNLLQFPLAFDSKAYAEQLRTAANFGSILDALVLGVCAPLKNCFTPYVSPAWVVSVILGSALASYLYSVGTLAFLAKATNPRVRFLIASRATRGRLWTLTLFYTAVDSVAALWCSSLHYRFFLAGGFYGETAPTFANYVANFANPAARIWGVAALAFVVVWLLVRVFAFHFAEPLVFRLAIPMPTALGMALGMAVRNFGRVAAYLAFLVAMWLAVFVAMVVVSMFIHIAIALPLVLLAALFVKFFVRVLGMQFQQVENPAPAKTRDARGA